MTVELLVERRDQVNMAGQIGIDEWREILEADPQLRTRSEPYKATNPRTREEVVMSAGEATAEICVDGEWLPFLRYSRGTLRINYKSEFEDPENELRKKIAGIARQLRAVVTSTAADDILEW